MHLLTTASQRGGPISQLRHRVQVFTEDWQRHKGLLDPRRAYRLIEALGSEGHPHVSRRRREQVGLLTNPKECGDNLIF